MKGQAYKHTAPTIRLDEDTVLELGGEMADVIFKELNEFQNKFKAKGEVVYLDAESYWIMKWYSRIRLGRIPEDKFAGADIVALPVLVPTVMISFRDNDCSRSVAYITRANGVRNLALEKVHKKIREAEK